MKIINQQNLYIMKHFTQATANGLCTPPCGSSQSKSTRFSLITSLLLFFLLMVGSSAAWALDYYVVGENWTSNSESAGWDKKDNNNFKMTKSGDVWYYKMNNINSSTNLQIKIRPSDDTENWDKQLYYGANHDTQNRGNVTLVESTNSEDKRRFAFQPSENSDVYLYTDGSQVWANAVPAGSSLSGKTIRLQGDLWTGTEIYDWGIATQSPTLEIASSGEYAATAFYLPVPTTEGADKYVQARFEIIVNGDKDKNLSISVNGATNASTDDAKTIAKVQGNQSSRVKYVQLRYYANHQAITTVSDAPAMTGDWYLYIDKTLKGQFVNGQLIVNDLPADNGGGYHSIYVAQRDDLANVAKEIKTSYPQGIAWLGGLYIDTENSSSDISWKKGCYGDAAKFSNLSTFPLINGTTGTGADDKGKRLDARGGFKLPSSGNTMFSLNNGVITIKKQGDYTSAVTFTDQSYLFFNKAQEGHGNYPQDNAHCYFYVWNANTSAYAYSDEAFYWDTNILIAKMPAGNWTHCILFRRSTAEKNIDGCWNKTGDIQLEEGKNYLTSAEATTWQNYTPRFYIASENGTISGGGSWNWNGNGTLHEGSFTKELSAGTYKFKVTPYVNSSGSTNTGWGTELNMYHYNSTLSNVSCSDENNKEIWFTLTATKDVTIAVSENGVTVNAEDPVAPVINYTVTIHPNGGTAVDPLSVGEGQTISSISSTYGNGTAKWYEDEDLTQEFILGTSTVTSDMDLYAKWGVSGNYYVVGDLQVASDASSTGNWDNNLGRQMTYPGSQPGVCSFSFVAPKGKTVFEIIKNKNWLEKLNGGSYAAVLDNTNSDVTLSVEGDHISFTLDAPKLVTVSLDGKVKVTTADVAFDNSKTWRVKTSNTGWGADGNNWDWNTIMTNNGTTNATAILRNVPAGAHRFIISTETSDGEAYKYVGNNTFHALYVDTSNPSSGLTWNTNTVNLAGNVQANNIPHETNDNYERRCKFTLSAISDVCITFDGGKIRCDILPKYTVTFNSNGGSEVASQSVFEGTTASEPSAPTKAGYEFDSWRIGSVEGDEYDFDSPVSSNVSLVAKWNQIITHTVSFNMDGGIPVLADVVVNEGNPVAQPADPTKTGYNFVEWQLSGSTYNFESPVMDDIELVAVWSFKAIESVNLNKSTLILYENSDPQTLTPSYLPADVLGVTYEWIVAPAGVVSVVNGVVTVVAPGTATITCTATDAESNSQNATCSVTVYEGEGCEMEEQSIFSHVIFGNSTTGGSASNNLLDQAALNPGMESTCRTIKMYYNGLTSEFTADEAGVVKAKSGLSDNSDVWYEIKGGTNANSYDGNFYYLKNVATGGYITRGDGIYGGNDDWKFYTTVTTPTNGKTNLYQFIYAKKDNQDNQKRICSVWNYNGTGSNQTYGLHRRNQDWADNYGSNCPNPMIVFGRGVNQGNQTLSVNFTVVATGVANPDYLSTPIVYDTRSYYRFSADAAVSLTLDKKLRAEDKVVVYCYNPSNAASNGALYINNNKVSDIQITANSALAFEYVAVDGDAGVNTIEVKSDDSNFCMASIEVLRSLPVIEQDPALTWSAPATHYTTVAAGSFTYVASSAKSLGAITYTSSDEAVATVANGVVTPLAVGTAKITASIEQFNCFGERSISYDVVVELPLQDAIDANSSLTLTHDYAEDAIINKAITINGNDHSIGNLTVQMAGDLTLSGALTVNDFSIYGQAGNSSVHATSGQVRNADNLTANGNAYFYYTIEPGEHVQHGWYDFTVPFPVNTASGIKGIQDAVLNDDFAYGTDYAILEHLGDKQAAGEYAYKKFQGVMTPCRLYSITLDDDYNYKTLRFQKTNDGALVAADAVTLNAYEGGDAGKANWNGVGNGTLHHANVGVTTEVIQVYQSGNNSFMAVAASSTSLAIGTAFMVQEAGTMTLGQASHALLAPRRAASVQPTAIQIASEGQPFSDQLFISADEMAGQVYTQGADVAKAGNIGNVNVPQIWTNAYNSKLCAHEAQLINGEASYTLSLYAPANGSYTLTSKNIPEGYTLYLTQNGNRIWNLSESYVLDLTKGTATEYGLLLVENYKMPTAIENIGSQADETQKIMRNGILYILRNGKVFNAQGARVQ